MARQRSRQKENRNGQSWQQGLQARVESDNPNQGAGNRVVYVQEDVKRGGKLDIKRYGQGHQQGQKARGVSHNLSHGAVKKVGLPADIKAYGKKESNRYLQCRQLAPAV